MTEDLRELFYVHSAFDGAGSERVPQGMKTFVLDIQSFQEQFKTSLVGADGNRFSVCRHHEGRIALFLYAFEDRQQLLRQRDHAVGSGGFRLVNNKAILAIVAGLGNGQNALCKVYIAPLQGDKFPDTQTTIQTENNTVQLIFLAIQDCLLYLLLLGECKAFHGLFFQLRAFKFVRRVPFVNPKRCAVLREL